MSRAAVVGRQILNWLLFASFEFDCNRMETLDRRETSTLLVERKAAFLSWPAPSVLLLLLGLVWCMMRLEGHPMLQTRHYEGKLKPSDGSL